MKSIHRWILAAALWLAVASTQAQTISSNSVLILYDSGTNTVYAQYGWIGNLHAKFLANLMGHFDVPYVIEPVESYQAGQISQARATFYFGLIYDNPLPPAFTNDVTTTANPVCWFKYNMWQVSGNIYFPQPLDSQIGFRFLSLDETGFTNIVYKNIALLKNPADPEVGVAGIINSNIATVVATAWETNADTTTTNVPYITRGGNFWYVGDSPFDYMGEQDRYLAFCDVLHDILGIPAAESHLAIIRLEDVTMDVYDPTTDLTPCVDFLHTNNIPFAMATIPYYTDPLGYYNNGTPESHRISDSTDSISTAFLAALKHALASGGQILIHGYTHQYSNVPNPYTGVTADDFEFWRETLTNQYLTNGDIITTNVLTDIYNPIPGDSTAWAYSRIQGATNEFTQAGLPWIGWETVHYTASAPDYQVFATNFNLTMQRVIYFADDYDSVTNPTHLGGQLFPYVIDKDIYGQKVVGESCGDYEPQAFENFAQHSVTDILNAAHATLVVRDGWANAFYHGFYGVTNLQQIVAGVQALGYTYVPIAPASAPFIITQPISQTNVPAGTNIFLGVAAIGGLPLNYQWTMDGTNLPGATNTVLVFPGVQTANSGDYTVVITNAFGSVTSSVAILDVGGVPIITTQPTNQTVLAGATTTFTVAAIGNQPISYQWFLGTNAVSGGTNATLTLANVSTNNAGSYAAVVSNPYGATVSAAATLTVETPAGIVTPPQSLSVLAGSPASFSVVASGTAPLGYQWSFNNATISGATNATYSLASALTNNAGTYTVTVTNLFGSTNASATLTVNTSPSITTPPQSQNVTAGTSVSFSVVAAGTAPLGYQWQFGAAPLSGATNATLSLANVSTTNAGTYTVTVTNLYGSTNASATLTVGVPPSITTAPKSVTATNGTTATFSVVAAGTAPLSYQWQLGAANLSGATNATLSLANVQTTNAGTYTVTVKNAYGSTNAAAVLTVVTPVGNIAPAITTQPKNSTNVVGTAASFTVVASGTAPLHYQWRLGGVNISGATSATYTISSVRASNAGSYTVVVTNIAGSVTSAAATLTVGTAPAILLPPLSQSVRTGRSVSFTVLATGTAPLHYQWRFKGVNIANATSATYTLTNVQAANAGAYSVVVSNPFGSATSANATLTVR
jgi:uncharacterized protein YdaL